MKKIASLFCLFTFLFVVPLVFAQSNEATPATEANQAAEATIAEEAQEAKEAFSIPQDAEKITDTLYRLKPSKDSKGNAIDGYAIVHKKKAAARRTGSLRASKCYGFFATGAKWKWVEPWVVNPTNLSGLTEPFVLNNLSADIAKWEDATDGIVGNSSGVDILGNGTATPGALFADSVSPDNQNEVYFDQIEDPDTIAVTIVWGYFGGLTSNRRLIEWDQVYSNNYPWSGAGEGGKMDFENIATHELGHSIGLNDIYSSSCIEQTMYGYADFGETKKRDLNIGDITGTNKLY